MRQISKFNEKFSTISPTKQRNKKTIIINHNNNFSRIVGSVLTQNINNIISVLVGVYSKTLNRLAYSFSTPCI